MDRTVEEVASTTMNLVWKQFGSCKGVDADIFYPVTDEEADAARAVCEPCPVREMCLEHAIAVREKHGVWGGLTERERRRLIRRRRRSA